MPLSGGNVHFVQHYCSTLNLTPHLLLSYVTIAQGKVQMEVPQQFAIKALNLLSTTVPHYSFSYSIQTLVQSSKDVFGLKYRI